MMRTGSSTLNYLLGDHLGSTTITASSSGSKTAEIRYYPWGTERYTSGTTPTTFHFTGQRLESYINLYWYGSRWYDAALGRFIQPDSIIPDQNDSQSWDRYCYTSNNPVRYTDPSGHCPFCIIIAITIVAAIVLPWLTSDSPVAFTPTTPEEFTEDFTQRMNESAAILAIGTTIGTTVQAFSPSTSTEYTYNSSNLNNEENIPVLEIDSDIMPNIADNIQTAQANGAPSVLTRMENQAAIHENRAAAISGFTGTGSPDEYPFASTYEGGAGAYVNGVPMEEQWLQGGVISQFYQNNNLVDGSRFRVLVK